MKLKKADIKTLEDRVTRLMEELATAVSNEIKSK